MSGFAKLSSSIVLSTVWREPHHVRIVWITMLALADARGYVEASLPGLADVARVTLPECEAALKTFSEPDPYSRTPDHEGRRIESVRGGWRLLNYQAHREGRASGAPCNTTHVEKPSRIYFIRSGDVIKIALSQNPWARLNALKAEGVAPTTPELLGHFIGTTAQLAAVHERFRDLRVNQNRDWFRADESITTYVASIATGSDLPTATQTGSQLQQEAEAEAEADPDEDEDAEPSSPSSDQVTSHDAARAFMKASGGLAWSFDAWRREYEFIASVCNADKSPRELLNRVCESYWRRGGWADKNRRMVTPGSLAKTWNTAIAVANGESIETKNPPGEQRASGAAYQPAPRLEERPGDGAPPPPRSPRASRGNP